MKLRHLIMVFFSAAAFLSSQPIQEPGAPIGPALQAAMEESIKNSGAVGVSAAVVFPAGEMWAGTAGISHAGVPLTTDMLFGIASVQKNLQAALALKLIEEGAIGLHDPLRKWLTPTPAIDGAITIRQLLNLTSGIKNFVGHPKSPFRIGYVHIDFDHTWTWQEIQDVFIDGPSFPPGTRCEYSSTNYIVLKQIIEKAARSKQSKLAEDRLLKPNRLDHTWVDFSRPFPERMRVAHGWFDTNDDGLPEDISGDSLNWIASLSPMLVYSTPSDVANWMHALYHRKTVLKAETLEAMLDFGGPVDGEPLMKGYGLGVVDINLGAIMPQWAHVRIYGHLGSGFGHLTFAGYLPEYGVALAMMSNRGGDRDSERAIGIAGSAVMDVLLRHLGAKESGRQP